MKRIAMFMHGGVAPAGSNQYVPAIKALVEHLSDQFDITVYTGFMPDGYSDLYLCGRATVRYVPHGRANTAATFVPLAVRAFRREHRMRPFSLVHGLWALPGGFAAVLAGKLAGIPSVVSLLGGEAASIPDRAYGNMRRFSTRQLTLWTLRHAGSITTLTGYQLDRLWIFGFRRMEGIRVIPFGADPELFPYMPQKLVCPPYYLLHVGHLNRVKDQRTLLQAFQKIRSQLDCDLRIVGEGPQEEELRRLVGELGVADHVTFVGFVPHHELREQFAWAHLLIHTSVYEGQGVVFSEAAASGVPICGTRVGLLADLGGSFGASVDPGDPDSLAQLVRSVLGDDTRRESLRREARAWASVHTAQWSGKKFAELYSRLLEPPTTELPAGDFPEFACPSCHRPLVADVTGWRCVQEGLRFSIEEGIPDFLLPVRRESVAEFLGTYQRIRRAEGWGHPTADYYRYLPYRDLSQRQSSIWSLRAKTYDCFLSHFSRLVGQRRIRCLDLGAGNCWFAAKIAERGHSVVVLDINLDKQDGLGSLSNFPAPQRCRMLAARAEFDVLPFGPGSFDVVIFNASLHYSSDVHRTCSEAMAVLRKQGLLYIIDSPIYRSEEAGEKMIQEQRESFAALLGGVLPERRGKGFLTESMLSEMSVRYRTDVLHPAYGPRWAMRPALARLLGRREPASFRIIAFHKD